MRPPRLLPWFALSLLTSCGGDEGPQGCTAATQCLTGAVTGAGGSGGSGGALTAGGAPSSGGSSSGTGGSASVDCSTTNGVPTALGACYVTCLYDGSLSPTYDRNGDCTKFGSKCAVFNYCMPNITCTSDKNCGTGRVCALGGQCLLSCNTDADCPTPPSGTPLSCKTVDTGTLVCRPFP